MIDYEVLVAMIKARMWKFSEAGNEEAADACEIILQDLETWYSIQRGQP